MRTQRKRGGRKVTTRKPTRSIVRKSVYEVKPNRKHLVCILLFIALIYFLYMIAPDCIQINSMIKEQDKDVIKEIVLEVLKEQEALKMTELEEAAIQMEMDKTAEQVVEKTSQQVTSRSGGGQARLSPSEEDVDLLARLIWSEADKSSTEDMRHVGVVVMNRIAYAKNNNYSSWGGKSATLKSVIYASGQYAVTFGNNPTINNKAGAEAKEIAKEILSGERYGIPESVIYQAQFKQGSGVYKQIGVHYYCYY